MARSGLEANCRIGLIKRLKAFGMDPKPSDSNRLKQPAYHARVDPVVDRSESGKGIKGQVGTAVNSVLRLGMIHGIIGDLDQSVGGLAM